MHWSAKKKGEFQPPEPPSGSATGSHKTLLSAWRTKTILETWIPVFWLVESWVWVQKIVLVFYDRKAWTRKMKALIPQGSIYLQMLTSLYCLRKYKLNIARDKKHFNAPFIMALLWALCFLVCASVGHSVHSSVPLSCFRLKFKIGRGSFWWNWSPINLKLSIHVSYIVWYDLSVYWVFTHFYGPLIIKKMIVGMGHSCTRNTFLFHMNHDRHWKFFYVNFKKR